MCNKKLRGDLRLCNYKALKTLRYSITTNEIIAIVHAFMRAHNKPIGENLNALSIYFLNETSYKKTGLSRLLPVWFRPYIRGQETDNYLAATATIHLFLPHLRTKRTFIKTLIHELDHVVWGLENEGKFNTLFPYWMRGHEIRARKTERKWYKNAKRIANKTKYWLA